MQSGGSDPEVLDNMHDLQAEALTLEQAKQRADGKTKGRSELYHHWTGAANSIWTLKNAIKKFGVSKEWVIDWFRY